MNAISIEFILPAFAIICALCLAYLAKHGDLEGRYIEPPEGINLDLPISPMSVGEVKDYLENLTGNEHLDHRVPYVILYSLVKKIEELESE